MERPPPSAPGPLSSAGPAGVLDAGNQALKHRDYATAIREFQAVIQNPTTPGHMVKTAKCKLVIALLADGQEDEAQKISREDTPPIPEAPIAQSPVPPASTEAEPPPEAESTPTHGGSDPSTKAKKRDRVREKKVKTKTKANKTHKHEESTFHCSYCNVLCPNKTAFETHKRSDSHQQVIMSDEGKVWKFRAPPRGMRAESYTLCQQFLTEESCRFGVQCVAAHSKEELREWKERFDYRQKKALKATRLYGKSFVETVIEKWSSAQNPRSILANRLDDIECSCDRDLSTQVESKQSKVMWTFRLVSKGPKVLRSIGLLIDVTRGQFSLMSIKHLKAKVKDGSGVDSTLRTYYDKTTADESEEWSLPGGSSLPSPTSTSTYEVKVEFNADIFGKFQQSVVFSFGSEPYLKQDISVDVVPAESQGATDETEGVDEDGLEKIQQSIISQAERWDELNTTIVDFEPPLIKPEPEDEILLRSYPHPQPSKFLATSNVKEPSLTRNNYIGRMHELLYIEEMAQFEQLSEFNVVTNLDLTKSYLLMPTSTNSSTAKYARQGELFGKMALGSSLSEDTPAGRLILTNCNVLYLSISAKTSGKRKAFTSAIEDSGKDTLFLRMSPKMVSEFDLKDGEHVEVEVQFQLNRVPLCEMHLAVDKLPDIKYVYPDVKSNAHVRVPWSPARQWADGMVPDLNPKQREAIVAITSELSTLAPPILIIGPYGTGKTYTLGHSIKLLLKQPTSRVLVCTHSNSAADLYIRDYLHPFIQANPEVKLVRVYYRHRWVQTVHNVVQKYCLINRTETSRVFRNPTFEDVKDANIVVATLSTSRSLNGIGLRAGHFSHILIDEAAQAMECEALMPLTLAAPDTRIVLAGDHMQLSPEVFSQFAKGKNFNMSLLERLYDLYPTNYPYKILLCENYRSHEAIINYTSGLFYGQKLVASGNQTVHDKWYPLTVFTARGEAIQDANSTSFYNNSEVYEVVDRVDELQRTWPKSWGHRDESSIGIVTPYYDQVQRIRSELRKRKLFGVSVERVLNVQGKQFRAIFLSTVRTRSTCIKSYDDPDECDFGFLSNAKLMNTAITRAQSLVAVVGDPIALCSVGKCRKLWEKFLEISSQHDSLLGMKWLELRGMLDRVELKKTYVLNPFAPEFIPRHRRQREAFLQSGMSAATPTNSTPQHVSGNHHYPSHGAANNGLAARFGNHHQPMIYSQLMYQNHGPPPQTPPPPPSTHVNGAPTSLRGFPPLPPSVPFMQLPPPMSPLMKISLANQSNFYAAPMTTQPPPIPQTMRNFYNQQAQQALMAAALIAGGKLPPPPPPPPRQIPPPTYHGTPGMRHPHSPSKRIPGQMMLPNGNQSSPPQHFGPGLGPHARLPNPQFANTKYQRQSGTSPSPPTMPAQGPPPPQPPPYTTHPPLPDPMVGGNGAIPRTGNHVHENPQPPVTHTADSAPSAFLEAACNLLPEDLDVRPFLGSAQMKRAWLSMVQTSRGLNEARQFTEVLAVLDQRPEFIETINLIRQQRQALLPLNNASPFAIQTHESQPLVQRTGPSLPLPVQNLYRGSNKVPMSQQEATSNPGNAVDDDYDEEIARLLQSNLLLTGLFNDNPSEDDISTIINSALEQDAVGTSPSSPQSGNPNIPLYKRRAQAQAQAEAAEAAEAGVSAALAAHASHASHAEVQKSESICTDAMTQAMTPTSSRPHPDLSEMPRQVTQPYIPPLRAEVSEAVDSNNGSGSKTYANVLRTSHTSEDPLTRIRNLGTQGNREADDQNLFNFRGAPW
ncbi:hypothetical protein TCAL_05962 [Tigriopus californicus]|uniref:C3H1-type domain-containing protein n=1 Tax=Tigriopus californicus TaxID=6832 RepID=A0A553NPZ6_TIGCA|nr:probable helicase with zinc finger domain isoform X2 [Tigriopus californicus]TRY67479.1 hypothetical protein TCAL_05962 [Tigriopus californicus]